VKEIVFSLSLFALAVSAWAITPEHGALVVTFMVAASMAVLSAVILAIVERVDRLKARQ
jgi:hypothetical protein